MATATEGYAYSRSSSFSAARSPDTASPIYPERAIRPLPNRRLKSRLSPEQQNTIIYPPEPSPVSPAFNLSVQETGGRALTNGDLPHHHHHHHHEAIAVHDHCTCKHEDGDSGDEEVEFDHPDYRYATPGQVGISGKAPLDSLQRRMMEASRGAKASVGPGSVASSADGYESFENTSNKKKRKIPLSSASSVHQSSLSAEMAGMGISHGNGAADDAHSAALQQQYASAAVASASGTGISGAGRGRYGRQNGRDMRRPLANTNTNAINGYGPRLLTRSSSGSEGKSNDTVPEGSGGIISQAIKTAAEQGPLTPQKGKENISLLQQSASSSATPKTQFTFTCESDSASKMVDQAQAMADAAYRQGYGTPTPGNGTHRAMNGQAMPPGGRVTNQGNKMAPAARGGPRATAPPGVPHATQPNAAGQHPPPPAPKPKPRRRPSKEFAMAARQRKLQQEYSNYHHRPTKDTMWICEFCEYEDIFGVPPHAMIRRYEIKDRAERKKAAEKRRLLEKAKMKNRKGKKNGKGKNNVAAAAAPPPAPAGNYDPNLPPPDGDDYYDDDEYGDEYEPVGPDDQYPADYYPPPPAPTGSQPVAGAGGGGGGGKPLG